MKKLLFVTYGGGHVNMVLPVIKMLKSSEAKVDIKVLALTTARSVCEREEIPCFSFRDLPIDDDALNYGKDLMHGELGHPLVPYEESVAYMGLSYQCLVEEHGPEVAVQLYAKEGRQAFLPVTVMERLIKDEHYDLVVATNSPRSERAAIIAAGNLNIPSVCIVDLFAIQGVKWLGQPNYATKVCVLSNEVKQHLCEAGRQNKEIVVTGNPAFDRLADSSIRIKGRELRHKKGWSGKKIVLWCSQPEPKMHPFTGERGEPRLPLIIEEKLQEICNRHQDEGWHLIVRPHPSEDMNQRQCLKGVEYDVKENLHPLLAAVDVVVVMSSTVGLEAVLLSKPLVSLDMSIFSKDMPFSMMGLSLGVSDLGGLEDVVISAFKGGIECGNKLDSVGGATKKVCDVIMSTLSVTV